jgi:hypothetical protein
VINASGQRITVNDDHSFIFDLLTAAYGGGLTAALL